MGYGLEKKVDPLFVLKSRQTTLPIPRGHYPEAMAGPLHVGGVDGTPGTVVGDLQCVVCPEVRKDASDRVPLCHLHVGTQQDADLLLLDQHCRRQTIRAGVRPLTGEGGVGVQHRDPCGADQP